MGKFRHYQNAQNQANLLMVMDYKMLCIVRTDLKMGKGKIAAQCGHAFIEAYRKAEKKVPQLVEEWLTIGSEKVVLKVDSEKQLLALFEELKKHFPVALIRDAGHTQIASGSKTCIAVGPALESELNAFTADLKLL
jgi:peptidyl-tRNA hydrolase, PTH2 family